MALNTGNPYLDSLGGTLWQPLPTGDVILVFSFAANGAAGTWTQDEASIAAGAVDAWLSVANIGFSDVPLASGYAINIYKDTNAEMDSPRDLAYADSPGDPTHDVHINTQHQAWVEGGINPGSRMYQTFIHELGHALGLEHPHDTLGGTRVFPGIELVDTNGNPLPVGDVQTDTGNFDLNTIPYTLMSYNDGPGSDYRVYSDRGFAITPMAFDIATIQTMYGAVAHNSGNDVYTLSDNDDAGSFFMCIWDTGGTDTLRYDGNQVAILDLRAATLREEEGGGGFLSRIIPEGGTGVVGGITIAADVTDFDRDGNFGVIIENAIGGFGRDTITGNDVTNVLNGRDGADTISGLGGADNLIGGLGADTLRGGTGDDFMTGGDGTGPDSDIDTFIFEPNWGHDTISHFVIGTGQFAGGDRLSFADVTGIKSLSQLSMDETDDGLTIGYQGNFITLLGISKGQLKEWNFEFNRKIEDGYLSGATVFADANGNGEFDAGEASTTTDANGTFILNTGSGPLIAFGGTDSSTGLPFKGRLFAPNGSVVITPLTTLLVAGVSQADLLAKLGLPAGIDLTLGDPIAGLLAGHAGSADVFVEGAKVIDTVIAIATAIAGLGGDESDAQDAAFAAIAAAINALGAGATLDLSSPATIAALVEDVAQQQGINAGLLVDALANAIADSNAKIDQHHATDGASQALLTNVSETQGELQANQSPIAVDDSVFVMKGKTLVGNVLANDSDPDGDPIQVVSVEGGAVNTTIAGKFGTLTVEADGDYQYIANKKGLPGKIVLQDSFDYGVLDDAAGVASAILTVLVLRDNYKLQAGANTTLTGTNGKDLLDGSAGGVTALGNKGADILIGGPDGILTGGKGSDIFVFRPDFGANVITDFEFKRTPRGDSTPSSDKIQIDSSVFATFADLLGHATDTAAGVLIDDGEGNTITLTGIKVAQLHAGDFFLV